MEFNLDYDGNPVNRIDLGDGKKSLSKIGLDIDRSSYDGVSVAEPVRYPVPKIPMALLVCDGKYGLFINNKNYYLHPLRENGLAFDPEPLYEMPKSAYGDLCLILSALMSQDTDVVGISSNDGSILYRHDRGGPCVYNGTIRVCFIDTYYGTNQNVVSIKGNGSVKGGHWFSYQQDPDFSKSMGSYFTPDSKNRFLFVYSQITGKTIPNDWFFQYPDGNFGLSHLG